MQPSHKAEVGKFALKARQSVARHVGCTLKQVHRSTSIPHVQRSTACPAARWKGCACLRSQADILHNACVTPTVSIFIYHFSRFCKI